MDSIALLLRLACLKLEIRLSQHQLNWIELNWTELSWIELRWIESELGNHPVWLTFCRKIVDKSTKFVHRCVSLPNFNKGKQRQTKLNKGKQRLTKAHKVEVCWKVWKVWEHLNQVKKFRLSYIVKHSYTLS